MDIILFLAIGLFAGAVARRMTPWRQTEDSGITSSFGIVGAFAGALLGRVMGYRDGAPVLFVAAMLGAFLIIAIYYGVSGHRTA